MNSVEGAADAARGTDSKRLENAYIAVIESEDLGAGALTHGITKGILQGKAAEPRKDNDHIIKIQFNPSTLSFPRATSAGAKRKRTSQKRRRGRWRWHCLTARMLPST